MEFNTKKIENNFRNYIAASITRSCNEAINNCSLRGRHVEEPDLVAHIIKELPHDLFKSLHAYSPTFKFNVTGVYCHQKPLADFGHTPCPELGDLLLVYIEENAYGEKKCNSLLLQAKRVTYNRYTIHQNEEHQLKLYSEWPIFKYKRAGSLNGVERNIIPKTINNGAQYLMMKEPLDDEKLYGCAIPSKNLVLGNKLSENIINLLKFSTGRTFGYIHPVEDDWTNMIWDLLNVAKSAKFNRKNSGIVGEDRLFLEMYGENFNEKFELLDDYNIDNIQLSDEVGVIPMLLIQGRHGDDSENY